MRACLRAAIAALSCLAFASTPARGAEGMWTFDNFPSTRMQEEMGWAPDQAWLDRVMAATARMPTCSGAVVSRAGLLLTNEHCLTDCITALSSATVNYEATGFIARTREEELHCPNLAIQVLTRITDVTSAIETATANAGADGFASARDAEIARLEGECSQGAIRCEVETLYDGGRYALYRYRRYEDVRLVFTPEHAMAAFGGDADNYSFPRYCVDFAFVRLYENGAPAVTAAHLRLRFTPASDGDVVLIAGNPGATSRLKTSAELAFERDTNLPWRIQMLQDLHTRLTAYARQGPDEARIASAALQTSENSLQGLIGRRAALADPAGFAHVTAAQADLQARVRRNQAAVRDTGDPWTDAATAMTAYRGFFYTYQLLEPRAAEGSILFIYARDLVRVAADRDKPEAQRLPRYTGVHLPMLERVMAAPRAISPSFEEVYLELWLTKLRQHLRPSNAALAHIFSGQSPAALAQHLAQTRLADPAYRAELFAGGAAAIAASDDPMIVFVRAWDADARAIRARYETQVEAPLASAQERIARVRFRAFGTTRYPDATFSPRMSYGRIEGLTDASGAAIPGFTTIGGLYSRSTSASPFALSQNWNDARAHMDENLMLNIASSTDAIGGSSGSPLLDRDGRVVGTLFDHNSYGLGGEYFYDGAHNRGVSVASTTIQAALANVYHMDALLAELNAP